MGKRFSKKQGLLKNHLRKFVFGCLFVIIGVFTIGVMSANVNAETATTTTTTTTAVQDNAEDVSCDGSLGSLAWLVCPGTGAVSKAVNFLYDLVERFLVVNPVEMEDGQPIYEIWKYMKGVANVVFICFFLVVIYSQITGLGISNYGIKKVLPKIIVVAILVNLSFIICSLLVDVSNIAGNGLRSVFDAVEQSTMGEIEEGVSHMAVTEVYGALTAGGVATIVGVVMMFQPGVLWLLIPTVFGGLVAILAGFATVAMRQAVVVLLVMVAPLAIVANMLPNTEHLFKKWKDLFKKMLVFYPMFSLLFGASNLAGWAIIMSTKNGFGVILGAAVQIFPLFFSWSLMKMSGTFLEDANKWIRGLAAKPLAANREWAESRNALSRARYLERNRMPSARLMNFLATRKAGREAETDAINEYLKAGHAARNDAMDYNSKGELSKRGLRRYNRQALTMRYKQFSQMHGDNMNQGFGDHTEEYEKTIAGMRADLLRSRGIYASAELKRGKYEDRINALDIANMNASDDLKAEIARGSEIDYINAKGFHNRALNAELANDDNNARLSGDRRHQIHAWVKDEDLARYNRWKIMMEGKEDGVQTIIADAASSLRAQAQIRTGKFQAKADLTPATQDMANHIGDLIKSKDAVKNIDAIIGGLRVLNMRGDTDMVAQALARNLVGVMSERGDIELGTYASQAIANYCMFDVKDNDPVLRRFGKYINMQTAAIYNENEPEKRRVRKDVSWGEYVNGEYVEYDEGGEMMRDGSGQVVVRKTRGMEELMKGTSYGGVERTAYKAQREGVRAASYELGVDGQPTSSFSCARYLANMSALYNSTLPNIIGDQFGYRSGSEQVMALAKDLTGIGKDGKIDWKYVFGDENPNPTLEQKAAFIMNSKGIVEKFLGGHVPSQIARSKTDVLQAIQSQYAMLGCVMEEGADGKERVNLERLAEFENRSFTKGDKDTPGSYNSFLEEKKEAVRKRFRASFKENALTGFAKQFAKGYQGEAKDLLISMLDPEEIYKEYNESQRRERNSRRRDNNEDDDEGMPLGDDFDERRMGGDGTYNETRERIRELYESYGRSRDLDVTSFWSEVNDALGNSEDMGDMRAALAQFAEGLPQYTNVHQLYTDILRNFFDSE